jgi:hypothetical protein
VITLDFPFEFDGERIEKLTMRRSKMGDRIWASKQGGTDEEKTAKLMARLCDTKPEVIAKLDDVDADKVDRQYGAFRGQGVS